MKTFIRGTSFKLVAAFVLSVFFIYNAFSGEIDIKPGQGNEFRITENSWQTLAFTHTTSKIATLEINADNKLFTRLIMQGYSRTDEVGSPELPVRRELIEVPLGAIPKVTIKKAIYRDIDLAELGYPYPLMPAQAPAVKSNDTHPFDFNPNAYMQDAYNPKELVSFEILGTMRSYRIGRVDIFAVQYNPVKHTLRVYEEIEAVVDFEHADIAATRNLRARYENFYYSSIGRSLANYQGPTERDTVTSYPISYLIVSDPMFESQLQPFIEWKTKQGFKVTVGYTNDPQVGSSAAMIKNYIQGKYNNPGPGNQPPSFVLFVGDIQQIPAWNGYSGSHVTDLYYCEYTNDLMPEIYYGRFSAQNPNQLQPQIDKTLQYEQYTMPDPSYLNEVVMVAGVDASHGHNWANGQINYGTINYFNESNGIISHTYLYPESGSHSADIIQDISNGVTYGNYTAHCNYDGWSDPPFLLGDIPSLQNQDEYCLLVGNCCLSSKYDESECFAEAIVRAQNKGAVAYIGASNSTYWDEDYYWGVGVGSITEIPPSYEQTTLGMYDRAFHTHGEPWEDWYTTADQHVYAGNLAVMLGAPGSAEYYWEIYCVMGDPSLMCFYSVPEEMEVEYLPLMPLGTASFTVETEAYAYVAISIDGVLKGAALADALGVAEVPLVPINVPGIADVVVTKQNRQPFMGTVIVANPEGPYILLNDHSTVELAGYANSKIEAGEVIGINIALRNYGLSDGNNVQAYLTSDDEFITISDNHENCGTVPAESTITFENAFSVIINDYIPDGHEVQFTVTIEDVVRETWISEMKFSLSAPIFNLNSLTVNDNAEGNGNGRLDPGESASITATFSNKGHAIARNTIAHLTAHSGFINITNPEYTIGNMGFFGNTVVNFDVEVNDKAPEGILADMMVNLLSGAFELYETKSLRIGQIAEDFESGNFSSFGWQQGGNLPWTIINAFPYEGYYSARSGAISNNQSSELSVSYYTMGQDSISFYRKVSSEGGDKLKFYVDNMKMAEWSGTTTGWKRESFYVTQGYHTFKWIYSKDGSGSSGSDAAWIDYIIFPQPEATTLYAGEDAALCPDDTHLCQATATHYESINWTSAGTGSFDNNTILQPVYTPSNEDIESGSVTLMMNIINEDAESFSDELTLEFRESPAQPLMPSGPAEINVDSVFISEYVIEPAEGADSYTWAINPPEAGYLTGHSENCIVVWNRDFGGTAAISVVAVNNCGESNISDELLVIVENSTVSISESETAAFDILVYPNPSSGFYNVRIKGADPEDVNISVYDIMGRECALNTELSPGIYVLVAELGTQRVLRKLLIR